MRGDVLGDLLGLLDHSVADEHAKAESRRLIAIVEVRAAPVFHTQDERVEFTASLMHTGVARAVIRERLMTRFSVSRTQAYRDLRAAL